MNQETHTLFASEIEEFARYTITLDAFKGRPIRYLDSSYWQKLSTAFRKEIVTQELAARDKEYRLIHFRYNGYRYEYAYYVTPDILDDIKGIIILKLTFTLGSVVAGVYAESYEYGKKYFRENFVSFLSDLLKDYTSLPKDPKIVRVAFSYLDNSGDASITSRDIICPSWEEIKPNYPELGEHVESILNAKSPEDLGKFIFWHGKPGTGKSYLIRSLMREWKKDVDFIYVIDPERFFNDGGYMKEILVSNIRNYAEDMEATGPESEYDTADGIVEQRETPLKLFIIEDGLSFLLRQSRERETGAMSRLLNLTDGILGQGLRLLFLVTSNEDEEDIDPAFLRKGRCLQRLEFKPLTYDQAVKWVEDSGKEYRSEEPLKKGDTYTLSHLYAAINKNVLPTQQLDKARIGIAV